MAKSEKLYKDSPTMKRGEDGHMGVHKPKEADKEDMGLAGGEIEGAGNGMPVHAKMAEMHKRHHEEMKSMHGRHESEAADMHKRHQKEAKGYGTETEQNVTGGSGASSTDVGAGVGAGVA